MTLTLDLAQRRLVPGALSPRAVWGAGLAGVVVIMGATVALSPRPAARLALSGAKAAPHAHHLSLAALLHLPGLRRVAPVAVLAAPSPAAPFVLHAKSVSERERAVTCLANAVYYEAALEPEDGQRAVAQVVLNRVRNLNFPHSVCGVVYQGWEKTTGCQFSFTCDGSLARPPMTAIYARARRVAEQALNGSVMAQVGWATHYHADYVDPWWRPTVTKIGQIGAHIFYRWPGGAGLPAAFTGRYAGGELALSEAALTGRAPHLGGPDLSASAAKVTGLKSADLKALGLAEVSTIKVAGPDGAHTRIHAVYDPAPLVNGRPIPTREQVARMNAVLAAKASASAPETPAQPVAAPAATLAPAAGS